MKIDQQHTPRGVHLGQQTAQRRGESGLSLAGLEGVMAITLAGLSRLLRLMAVNTARIASAADEVLRSSTWVTNLARWPAEPLTKGTMPSTATPVAFSTWEAEHSVELLGGNRARHAERAVNDEGSEQAGLVLGELGVEEGQA